MSVVPQFLNHNLKHSIDFGAFPNSDSAPIYMMVHQSTIKTLLCELRWDYVISRCVTADVHGDRSSVWSGKVQTTTFRVKLFSFHLDRHAVQLIAFSLQQRVRSDYWNVLMTAKGVFQPLKCSNVLCVAKRHRQRQTFIIIGAAKKLDWYNIRSVSYTHLTLPTNREV